MTSDSTSPGALEQLQAEVRAWRAAHPQATFAEIEVAVEARLSALRGPLVEAATGEPAPAQEPPCCPICSGPLQRRGPQPRALRVPGNVRVQLERAYATCPVCEQGLFPPG